MRRAKNYFIFLVLCMILVFFCFTWFGSSVESWLIVDAVPRHYVGISDAGGDLLSAYWLQFPAGSVSITNEVATINYAGAYQQNLLTNTQLVFCSNSDTNKGIATMTYDTGSAGGGDIPDPGDSGTGGTSGATLKVISVTVSTGAFATNDATGTIEIGASAGCFHDNETVTFTDGETVVVNHPNSAAGVDGLIQNGEFSVDTDPPPGWTAVNNATLTTEAGGKIGNCLMITCDGSNNPQAHQTISVTAGKNYYFIAYVKAGTEATYNMLIYDESNAASIATCGSLEETAGDWSTNWARYFKAPSGCSQVTIKLYQMATAGAATTIYFDEVSCYEVTRCCTGADNLDFDGGWYKDTTLDVYYQFNDGGTLTHDGCFGSLKCVPSAANDFRYWPNATRRVLPEWTQKFAGKTVTFAVGCLSSTASHAFIQLIDSDTTDYDQSSDSSSYHTGDGTWQWLTATMTVSASTTEFSVAFVFDQSAGVTYFTMPMLSFGSSIGAWNYVPEADKRIYFENIITSQGFHAKIAANGFSDMIATELILESDAKACVGKGIKAMRVQIAAGDSGSAANECYFKASYDISAIGVGYINSPEGLANDSTNKIIGWIPCNSSGNYEYQIEATGANTFDINSFTYIAGEWR